MILRVIIYVLIVLVLGISQYQFGLLDKFGISERIIALLFFVIYLCMLYSQVKSEIAEGGVYKKVRDSGFVFSFCVGIIWGVIMSFSAGFPKTTRPLFFFLMIIGWMAIGGLFGLLGIGLAKALYRRRLRN